MFDQPDNDIPAATSESAQDFCSLPFAKTCPLSWWAKRACPLCDTLILPASRASRYNTLHLCSKGCVPKGGIAPFGNPTGFARKWYPHLHSVWPHFSQIRKTKVGAIRPSIGRAAPFCFVLRPRRCRSKSDYNFPNRVVSRIMRKLVCSL